MKIAIASSGLGHVARGIETWAYTTANALHRRGVETTLFAAAPVAGSLAPLTVLHCLKRTDPCSRLIKRIAPGCSWRWHLQSPYDIEQATFWWKLKKHLIRGRYDILHVQDPFLALLAQRASAAGRIPCRCLLAHGTEETPDFLQQFPFLQHLAPWHLEQTRRALAAEPAAGGHDPYCNWVAIPNFVDTGRFSPCPAAPAKQQLRAKLGLPADAIIWGTSAAIKRHHKRIDWLLREFSTAAAKNPALHLLVVGSRQQDTDLLRAQANQLAPGRITFMVNQPHEDMPQLLQAMDAFVLTSLFEMMPIALLEALASALPVHSHTHPVMAWMAGPGGRPVAMDNQGELASVMQTTTLHTLQQQGLLARQQALDCFSEDVVIPAYMEWYQHMMQQQGQHHVTG